MSRQPRIAYPGAFYHVMARGNERRTIFSDGSDFRKFLILLGSTAKRHRFIFHAYVLMPNHYHLLLETPAGELSRGMQHVNQGYAQYFNARHDRVGHLFQGRFKALLVERDSYFITLSRYIHQNPVHAGLVRQPWEYQWSSCSAVLGLGGSPVWLNINATLGFFGEDIMRRRASYKRLVMEPLEHNPLEQAIAQMLLGGERFVAQVKDAFGNHLRSNSEFSKQRELEQRPESLTVLEVIKREMRTDDFNFSRWKRGGVGLAAVYLLREKSRLTFTAIGRLCGLGNSGVRKRFAQALRLRQADSQWRERLDYLESRLAGGITSESKKCEVQV